MAQLAAESEAAGTPPTDLLLHIGDLAYATGYESEWDRFMSQIEPLSSRAPYMTMQGNHERDYPGSGNAIGGADSGGAVRGRAAREDASAALNGSSQWHLDNAYSPVWS